MRITSGMNWGIKVKGIAIIEKLKA